MSANDERRLLLACLVALLRRSRGSVVIDEGDIELAYSAIDEVTWRRDPVLKVMRLSVPREEQP